MCGISGIAGTNVAPESLRRLTRAQHHRGPDAHGDYVAAIGQVMLGHNRLSILDLSDAGRQPMTSASGRYVVVFNGEIYNYLELRRELTDYQFRTQTDTEVLLAAFEKWGAACLDRLLGMFAFAMWDTVDERLFLARDRFGVKPLYYHCSKNGTLTFASEIGGLHAAGIAREPDDIAWSTYLTSGLYDHCSRTFWRDIHSLPAGHWLTWHAGRTQLGRWYDLAERVGNDVDTRDDDAVQEEYTALLLDSIRLRFRADVPVGINLSGGLDSSLLLGLVRSTFGPDCNVHAFTFTTGDERYDETPWVRQMLHGTQHPWHECRLLARDVPSFAAEVHTHQQEPFGGLPTLAYAKLFAAARAAGVIVLLDGQGIDEQWAGYDYYASALHPAASLVGTSTVQGTRDRATRPECLTAEFRALAEVVDYPRPFADPLRNLQYRDACITKIPRALRFNDRISMQSSTELREPFLDHRLFELALRQPVERKIRAGVHKWLPRRITAKLLPRGIAEAPKRPLQTPQREWLREDLRPWVEDCLALAVEHLGGRYLDETSLRNSWQTYLRGESDNSFYVWQWISLALLSQDHGSSAWKSPANNVSKSLLINNVACRN